jgi:hypothetical protein
MAIYRFELHQAQQVSLRERDTADAVSAALRFALSVRGFDEHVIWPTATAVHAIVEGEGPDELAEMIEVLSFTAQWTDIEYATVAEPEDPTGSMEGWRRSASIVRAALEGEESRCDFCTALNPPPHNGDCPFAKRQGTAESPGGLLKPWNRGSGGATGELPVQMGVEASSRQVEVAE